MNEPQDPEAAETVQTTNVPAVPLTRLVRRGRGIEYILWVHDGPKRKPRFLAGITLNMTIRADKKEVARWERAIQAGLDVEFNSPQNAEVSDR